MRLGAETARLAVALAAIGSVTFVYAAWLHVSNAAIVSTTFLLVVLVVAATSRLWIAVTCSLVSMLCINFFFLPPVGTFTIAEPQNWMALFAFLFVSLVASNLSAVARARTQEAFGRRDEVARLFDVSRDVLMMTDSREGIRILARTVARRFDLDLVAIALPRADQWDVFEAGARGVELDRAELTAAFAAARAVLEFDAYARTYSGHRTMVADGHPVRLVPLRVGTRPIGLLAVAGEPRRLRVPGLRDAAAGEVLRRPWAWNSLPSASRSS
jgi:two-component system sensor histidine kinase KdpD